MRSFVFWALLLFPSGALAQEDALRSLARGTAVLRSDAGATYAHLRLLEQEIFGRAQGTRVTITQESSLDPFYRQIAATYALDGQVLLNRRSATGLETLTIHDGILAPGEHTLSVVLVYVGDGHGVIGYLPGYRFTVRSSYQLTVPNEGAFEFTVRPFTRGLMTPFEDRLSIEYEAHERARD